MRKMGHPGQVSQDGSWWEASKEVKKGKVQFLEIHVAHACGVSVGNFMWGSWSAETWIGNFLQWISANISPLFPSLSKPQSIASTPEEEFTVSGKSIAIPFLALTHLFISNLYLSVCQVIRGPEELSPHSRNLSLLLNKLTLKQGLSCAPKTKQ